MGLPAGQSAFLWGARQTGKSTYLKNVYPKSIRYDLLQADTYNQLNEQLDHFLFELWEDKIY